jgi:hypothetical protein
MAEAYRDSEEELEQLEALITEPGEKEIFTKRLYALHG